MRRAEILQALREPDPERCQELWRKADAVRQAAVGSAVHLRGLAEISNHCRRDCSYCGIRAGRPGLSRYRLTAEEVLSCAHEAVRLGFGTIVLQAGEDLRLDAETVARMVRAIKEETPLAVTLSLGERTPAELARWRAEGADRYLLRFETSNARLFARLHPPLRAGEPGRIDLLRMLRDLGYAVGSGFLVGLPGQTWEDLASDLLLCRALDLDMIGLGPYIPHPQTPLGRLARLRTVRPALADAGPATTRTARAACPARAGAYDQVPADAFTTCKALALARLLCPRANIPATTALATVDRESGRESGLRSGANVVMPNLTPARFRDRYEIYPGKACLHETAAICRGCLERRLRSLGRTVGEGRGDAPASLAAERTEA